MSKSLRRVCSLCGLAFIVAVTLLIIAQVRFGSLRAAGCYLRGQPVFLLQDHTDVGFVCPSRATRVTFTIKNSANHDVRILGVKTNCGCTVVDDLPFTLAAGDARTVSCWVTPSEAWVGKKFSIRATLFTSVAGDHPVFTIVGEVRIDDRRTVK